MDIKDVISRNFPIISDEYEKFALKKDKCRKCEMYAHYKQVGMSEGNAKDPTFMFIGESLGKDEVAQNRPFIGLAGQRLRSELRKYPDVFKRDTMLVSNVLPCRPLNNKFPGSDKSYIVTNCVDLWLKKEIALLRPKVIVALGAQALKFVRGDWGITANRGEWKFLPEYRAWSLATFHPSYVIRNQNSGDQHIVDFFEQDIKNIATTWYTVVGSDERMTMSDEEWAREKAFNTSVDMGLIDWKSETKTVKFK